MPAVDELGIRVFEVTITKHKRRLSFFVFYNRGMCGCKRHPLQVRQCALDRRARANLKPGKISRTYIVDGGYYPRVFLSKEGTRNSQGLTMEMDKSKQGFGALGADSSTTSLSVARVCLWL